MRLHKKAMVVLSGGQDSTTCLFWAKANFDEVCAITFDYGQKHSIELEAAAKIAHIADVEHEIVCVPQILRSRSPLTNPNEELETYKNYEEMDSIIGDRVELTFVPMRNAFFLTLAANYALEKDCYALVTGVCEQDNANYPDCRLQFIQKQEETINEALGLNNEFHIFTPLINLTKAQIILLSKQYEDCWQALSYSHTCYAGKYPPCGECHSCVLRAQGFKEAEEIDPLIKRVHFEAENNE
jgi:7-cyano-7-deazaguanine synthase